MANSTNTSFGRAARRWQIAAGVCALLSRLLQPQRALAENHVDYKYEDYNEDNGRIHIRTHSFLFETVLAPWFTMKGSGVYDGISGATPTGAPAVGTTQVPTAKIEDIRHAGYVEPTLRLGQHSITPQLAYSKESDYESWGMSLTYSLEFNDKNTTLTFGVGHNADKVIPNGGTLIRKVETKDTTDYLLGFNQLLGPKTVLSADLTIGYSHGYQADAYKGASFAAYNIASRFPELRPRHRFKQVGLIGLTQYVDPLNASAEVSYRYYHDSYRIHSHTIATAWNQKFGKHIVVSPQFRFYNQSAAYFYGTQFDGDPTDPTNPPPTYYSADFRLSEFNSYTYGAKVTWIVNEHVNFDVAARRYEMNGLDGITPDSAYCNANIFTVGIRLWF